jgi:ParB family chromosome partitioning protein
MAKAKKRQAMGRGLSALLPTDENLVQGSVEGKVIELPLNQIETNPFQPRTQFNPDTLAQLASSISELGVIQPITVRKLNNNRYQLVSGERRFRASQSINLKSIPAFVRVANDQESLEMALVENIQRDDLDSIEIALSYDRLINEIKLTQEQMSKRVGKKEINRYQLLAFVASRPHHPVRYQGWFYKYGSRTCITQRSRQARTIKVV